LLGLFRKQMRSRSGHGLWLRLVLAFTLAAFAQASYVTQTHIHVADLHATSSAAGPNEHKNPLRDDPAHCPLCQEFLLAGAYIAPAPVLLPLPTLAAFHIPQHVRELIFVAVFSHAWYGRGPPLH
jgi:hypothetical protein